MFARSSQVATVVLLMLLGASVGPLFMATQSQVLHVAPGRTETALAAPSAAFNVGVAVGALLGGALLPLTGIRGTFLACGLLTAVARVVLSWPESVVSRAAVDAPGTGIR
ncbi:MFS transporter [Streptomyces canus]|uniref:MFS transporter n=1 Tax=Streptomyces canus TaxID=58343 RepID=UPI003F4B82BE